MSLIRFLIYIGFTLFFFSCATYNAQYLEDDDFLTQEFLPDQKDFSRETRVLSKTFYLIGDAGGASLGKSTDALIAFKKVLDTADTKGDYTVFLGDNIYDKGLPPKDHPNREDAEFKIDAQIQSVTNFKGQVYFIPGNHDWYDSGPLGVKREEKYIEKALNDKNAFQPENGCPLKTVEVSDEIVLIMLDTEWYLANWDKYPTINANCDIKTRDDFFIEIESELKRHSEKTIILATHHPMFTNGIHGGSFALRKHLFPSKSNIPLPGLATLVTQLRGPGGISPEDNTNKKNRELMNRLSTMISSRDRVVVVSGHEHSIQYINHKGIKQIVSGSGAKRSEASLSNDGLFAYGAQGFAILDVYSDGSSFVRFYAAAGGEPSLVFQTQVHEPEPSYELSSLPSEFTETVSKSAYKEEATQKGKGYINFWGKHYREVYGTPINVPVVTLDSLLGGTTIQRKGGGQQTRSLRLLASGGKEYNLRAVNKSATQFLQATIFKEDYIKDSFDDTYTQKTILDFYTSSHPYASLAMGDLSDAIGVYHTNPQLVWMPKHKSLGKYNEDFGDELYMLEEHPNKNFLDVTSFGKPDDIESTSKMLEKLRKDEKYEVDQDAFIRARLFDMLLGDWDRHLGQWRWARFDKNKKKVYKPIPRDRDQIFSNYDGAFLNIIKTFVPPARKLTEYEGSLKDFKWINLSGSKLDRLLLSSASEEAWIKQASYIQDHLTDAAIDEAFLKLPKEVQNEQLDQVIAALKQRRASLSSFAQSYYAYLSEIVILNGTDKDDRIEITREDNRTRVQISRIKTGQSTEPFVDRVYTSENTKEIWIYGLGDTDTFIEKGMGSNPVKIRIIGGQDNDVYRIENGKRIKIYDQLSLDNTVEKKGNATLAFTDRYTDNLFTVNKAIGRTNTLLPSIGFNPDDGLVIGIQDVLINQGFYSPFQNKHTLSAGYYTSTGGITADYQGEFNGVFKKWSLILEGDFTSNAFAQNFFGLGNETGNEDDIQPSGLDFNRVRTGRAGVDIGIVKDNNYGSRMSFVTSFETIKIEDTQGRFITEDFALSSSDFFSRKYFAGVAWQYSYHSTNNDANPSNGMLFDLDIGSTINVEETERIFGYIQPSLAFYNALSRNKKWVLKSQVQGRFNVGNDFEFYQAATLGGANGLRGFRNDRFTGKSALAFSGDLRYSFNQAKSGLFPLQFGLYAGGDVGRVWLENGASDLWHNSYGGGFWLNAANLASGSLGVFNSSEGLRLTVGLLVGL